MVFQPLGAGLGPMFSIVGCWLAGCWLAKSFSILSVEQRLKLDLSLPNKMKVNALWKFPAAEQVYS